MVWVGGLVEGQVGVGGWVGGWVEGQMGVGELVEGQMGMGGGGWEEGR